MSVRRWTERIRDILSAITEIGDFIHEMSREQFLLDAKTIKAVELDFIVIGEAASQVPVDVQERHPDVPWRVMKAMRNRLVHVYFEADPQIVWETIVNDLPTLLNPLQRLLVEEPDARLDTPSAETPPSESQGQCDESP